MTEQEKQRIEQIRARVEGILPTPCTPLGASSELHDVPRALPVSGYPATGPIKMCRDYGEFFGHAKQDIEFLPDVIERTTDARQLGLDFENRASVSRA